MSDITTAVLQFIFGGRAEPIDWEFKARADAQLARHLDASNKRIIEAGEKGRIEAIPQRKKP